jgi:membrane protein required for colicin V production
VTIDLVILGAVLLFGIIGAITGAARQIAHSVAMVAAYASARPLGSLLGARAAASLQVSVVIGTVLVTIATFLLVLVLLRYALTALLRRLMSGDDPEDRSVDRMLGFTLGGLKVAAMFYVVLSGLTFAEEYVSVAGKKLGVSPKDSAAFALARNYNLFEYVQFSGVRDLVQVAKASRDPQHSRKLQANASFKALRKDPRFQKAVNDPEVLKAAAEGDFQALLKNTAILQLVQDPKMAAHIATAATLSQQELLAGAGEN